MPTAIGTPQSVRRMTVERAAMLYARLAVGTAFLSAVAGRFGIWDRSIDWQHFERFIRRTGEVNAFMPAFTIPFLAVAATAAEISFGIALIVGFKVRLAAFGSAILLAMFATAMAISTGIKPPLDYSVFSASAAALLLALRARQSER